MIRKFTEAYHAKPEFAHLVDHVWKPTADRAIDAVLHHDAKALKSAFQAISDFQRDHLRTFIPKPIRKFWQGNNYRLKICGAGGGGMLLGLADRPNSRIRGLGKVRWLRTRELTASNELPCFAQSSVTPLTDFCKVRFAYLAKDASEENRLRQPYTMSLLGI